MVVQRLLLVMGLMAVGLLAQGVGLVGGLYRLFDGVLDDQACRALCVGIGVAYFSFSAWGLVSCSRGLIRVRNLLKGKTNAAKRKRNKAAPLCCSDMRCHGYGWSLTSLMGMVAVWTVTANAAVAIDVVKGWVRLETTPSLAEIAKEYATTDARRPEHAALQIMKRQAGQGIPYSCIPVGVEVVIQTLPGFEVVGRGKVDREGNYSIGVRSTNLLRRAYCRLERNELGRRVRYVGSAHVEQRSQHDFLLYGKHYYTGNIILMRSYASAEGRCVQKGGIPVQGAYVSVRPITSGETEEECRLFPMQLAVTDAAGRWRVDGLAAPPIVPLTSYICYTNIVSNWQVCHYPLQLGISVRRKPFGAYDVEKVLPNVTDENRRAVERAIAATERKLGKKVERLNRMTDFPASTNTVIYVPDIVLP